MPFLIFWSGSFAVQYGDHFRSGIICSPIWGSFAVRDRLRSWDHLRTRTDRHISRGARNKSHVFNELPVQKYDLFYCNVLNNNSSSHLQSLTACFLSVFSKFELIPRSAHLLSHEDVSSVNFAYPVFKQYNSWTDFFWKRWHLCMWDERIRRHYCQNSLRKTPHSAPNSEQCRVLVPSSTVYAGNAWDHDEQRLAFYDSGFPTEARVKRP